MGVVRRNGDWRLEKQDGGFYEVTYQGTAEMMIATSDYRPGMVDERFGVGVPVREVDSFSEAEALFEEKAKRGDFKFSDSGIGGSSNSGTADGDDIASLEELPPGGFALALIGAGAYIMYIYGFAIDSPSFLVSAAMILIGLGIFGWAYRLYRAQGLSEAWEFLTTREDKDDRRSTGNESSDDPQRTPPAPQKLKDDLYFDRANQKCEWCDERVDQPEVHHIEPRSEGGPNTPSNLIVLCPSCHAKADAGTISKTKLRSKVQRVIDTSAS